MASRARRGVAGKGVNMPKEKEIPNPWFDFRGKWTSREAAARARERMWQIVALLSCLSTLIALGGFVHLANSSRLIPYVVEVDKAGAAVGIKAAERMERADPRIVRYTISSFISESRMVSLDMNVQKRAIFRVYSMINQNDVAFAKMNEYLNSSEETTPFARARKVTVETEIVSMIPQTDSSWEVDWVETIRNRNSGVVEDQYRMRANLSYYMAPPDRTQTAENMMYNPLALFVRDFNWGRIQEASTEK